jgi:L-serine/L-threonine ammonia-lyase
VVPRSTPEAVRARLAQYGASVVVHGEHWAQAHEHAQLLVSQAGGSSAALIHPFEGEATWGGHATLVGEIRDQLPGVAAAAGHRNIPPAPGCIALSVGGGGLLMGVLRGCRAVGWTAADTAVLAVETVGADCLTQAVNARSPITLPGITSIASSLGAPTASPAALQACLEPGSRVACATVEDADAIDACLRLLKDHRMLVEPACGAALAPVYRSSSGSAPMPAALAKAQSVVVIVCGGANVQHDALLKWQAEFVASRVG